MHGEPVSPSPSKDTKRRRILKGWYQDIQFTELSDLPPDIVDRVEGLNETPTLDKRTFQPLFGEILNNGKLFENFMPLNGEREVRQSVSSGTNSMNIKHPTTVNIIEKDSGTLVIDSSRDKTTDRHIAVTEWQASQVTKHWADRDTHWIDNSVARGLMKGSKLLDRSTDELEVRLPDNLKQMLSLRDSQVDAVTREEMEVKLTSGLLHGQPLSLAKGIQTWMAGEFEEKGPVDSEEEWDGHEQEWTGEL